MLFSIPQYCQSFQPLLGIWKISHGGFICSSQRINDVEHLFVCLLTISVLSFVKYVLIFYLNCLLLLSYIKVPCTFAHVLSNTYFANIFPHAWLFIPFFTSFYKNKSSTFWWNLIYNFLYDLSFFVLLKKSFPNPSFKNFSFFVVVLFIFIEVWLRYNSVLITAVQQSDSVIHTYIRFQTLFHYGLSQDIEYTSCATQWNSVVYPSCI